MINLGAALAGGGGKRRELDFYPTPWEATAALCDEVALPFVIWEPACGDGAMAEFLKGRGHAMICSDIANRGYRSQAMTEDFLEVDVMDVGCEAIVTNPPFNLAEKFIRHALTFTPRVAMLLKATFPNAIGRLDLFEKHPPSRILPLSWRLDFTKAGSPHTDCTWFVWGIPGTPFKPLRKPVADYLS